VASVKKKNGKRSNAEDTEGAEFAEGRKERT
jgi:hypothetical protein